MAWVNNGERKFHKLEEYIPAKDRHPTRMTKKWIKHVESMYNVRFREFDDLGKPVFSIVLVNFPKVEKVFYALKISGYPHKDTPLIRALVTEMEQALKETPYKSILAKTRPTNFKFPKDNKIGRKAEQYGMVFIGWDLAGGVYG